MLCYASNHEILFLATIIEEKYVLFLVNTIKFFLLFLFLCN